MPNKKELRELVEVTRQHINLLETVIEKDYYVTQIIHNLSGIENEYFRLVFCGGTCLAKAHKLVKRMSEDVDFKVQLKNKENLSRSHLNKELKKFHRQVKSSLILPELSVSEEVARNEGKYQRIVLKYPYSFPMSQTLRPEIMLEFTLSDIRLPINELQVKTIIEDTLKDVHLFTSPIIKCVSINETAIEKWVGLTRRVSAIELGREADDKTLIRHLYDLNAINQANKVNSDFIELAKSVIKSDAKQFKNQHLEYAANPEDLIKQSLALLKSKPLWKERYDEFIEVMVYDNTNALEYGMAISVLERISERIINYSSLPISITC